MVIQSIVDIPEICHRHGIRHAVISPGSRNAPVIMALARHRGLTCYVVPDERSAGYIALGIAQSTRCPVILSCTSGTAALNYAPAIAEAFYQQIPLLVLTADRPPERVDQNDGQAIRQTDLYRNHIRYSSTLPMLDGHADTLRHCHRIVSEAILMARRPPCGPVHINVPIREPFYPDKKERLRFPKDVPVIDDTTVEPSIPHAEWQALETVLNSKHRILVVAGQGIFDPLMGPMLQEACMLWQIPVLADHCSNLPPYAGLIRLHDEILSTGRPDDLLPDLVITFGQSILSKKLKTALRDHTGYDHWHVGHEFPVPDPFGALSRIIPVPPFRFFQAMAASANFVEHTEYFAQWTAGQKAMEEKVGTFFPAKTFGEFEAVMMALDRLPETAVLHLANSMPVRYAQVLSSDIPNNVRVYSNRGTSGIDGCSSTMAGHALVDGALHVLITGDMAFLYDRNAFWHNHVPPNIRIIVLNNGGGGIFRLIPGPDRQPELKTYMETIQKQNAANTAADFGFTYYHCKSRKGLSSLLQDFYKESSKPKILEITTKGASNQKIWHAFKSYLKK